MVNALDLTQRQSARLLEQAVRTQARLEIEPRNLPDGEILTASIVGRQGTSLVVSLNRNPSQLPPLALIGAFCEVRSTMLGQIFLFTSCVVDVVDAAGRTRLTLSLPDIIQVANRRRHERNGSPVASTVRLTGADGQPLGAGPLANLSADGLACTIDWTETADEPLVGDELRVSFELAGIDESFELPAVVCNKSRQRDSSQLLVGLEFTRTEGNDASTLALNRVRSLLTEMMSQFTKSDGDE